jgi:hypothetical protein
MDNMQVYSNINNYFWMDNQTKTRCLKDKKIFMKGNRISAHAKKQEQVLSEDS